MADAHANDHDYHLVDPSPWPFVGAVSAFFMALGAVAYMHGDSLLWIFPGFIGVLYTMAAWWRDVINEAHTGHHTRVVAIHLRYGMILFIASEVMFFVAWFWAFFDASLFYDEVQQYARLEYTGGQWPPVGIQVFDPWHLPLLNTLILLTSGTTVTWAHHALLNDDRKGLIQGLAITVVLGVLFSFVQGYEYAHA
ncbi:MAG: cytochrome c oxidase subunit 3, partial [Rhizobiales bacterium]|nr:cytochrome c oxidase subunit 3 [Hyphomicrobiales bacterium]